MPATPFEETPNEVESSPEKLRVGFETARGEDHLENEDAILVNKERGVYGVFDGVGGHNAGGVASRMARDFIARKIEAIPGDTDFSRRASLLAEAILDANKEILRAAQENPEQYSKMGTTATLMEIGEDEGKMRGAWINIGDSRLYRLSSDGELMTFTLDDSFARKRDGEETAIRFQRLFGNIDSSQTFNDEESEVWRLRNVITNYLGLEAMELRSGFFDVAPGEVFLLSSDGIHDNLTNNEIAGILSETSDPSEASRKLVQAAQARSRDGTHMRHKKDDMSAVVVRV